MNQDFQPDFSPGPHALVYKTKGDYDNLVPVVLSDDKKTIISYPHPNDLRTNGVLAVPTLLKNNYRLDNRGIGKNVAFLKLTYEEYSKLDSAPALNKMYELIIDQDPLSELYDCGNKLKYKDIVTELNVAIEDGSLGKKCKKIK